MRKEQLKRAVLSFIQPLQSGVVKTVNSASVILDKIKGFGEREAIRANPYGFVSHPVRGVGNYILNLAGNVASPIILAELDKLRPETSTEGEVILYARSGQAFPVIITLKPDGNLNIKTDTEVHVESPKTVVKSGVVELGDGALEKIVNGETFQTLYNNHTHLGNAGVSTGKPEMPMTNSELSSVVKAAT